MRSRSISSEAPLPGAGRQSPRGHGTLAQTRAVLQTLRPHQWVKNVLVFVPLAAAHRLGDGRLLTDAAAAFGAFTLCAAAVYVLNDLIDAPADRLHPHKSSRPLASGRLSPALAAAMVPLLLCAALAAGAAISTGTAVVLALYFALMVGYTLWLRARVLLDALVLAVGYSMRVAAGALAVKVLPSSWLLAFCVFLFFSLALVKRYAELALMQRLGHCVQHESVRARGYLPGDQEFVLVLGVSTGTLAVLVLALYLSTAPAAALYSHAAVIWTVCVLLLYWLSRMWLTAHRGLITDDPLVFALKDRVSQVLAVLMGAAAWLAV